MKYSGYTAGNTKSALHGSRRAGSNRVHSMPGVRRPERKRRSVRLGKSPLRNSQNGLAIHKKISIERNGRPFRFMLIFVYCGADFDSRGLTNLSTFQTAKSKKKIIWRKKIQVEVVYRRYLCRTFIPSIDVLVDSLPVLRDAQFIIAFWKAVPKSVPNEIVNSGLCFLLVCPMVKFCNPGFDLLQKINCYLFDFLNILF